MYDILITMDRIQIADYLAKKVFNGELNPPWVSIMLKNKQIYDVIDYNKFVKSNKISPKDAFVYIDSENYSLLESYNLPADYLFPFINSIRNHIIMKSYVQQRVFVPVIYRQFYLFEPLLYPFEFELVCLYLTHLQLSS